MKLSKTDIDGLYVIEPIIFEDRRGCFFESYNRSKFEANGLYYDFIQDNQSRSRYGTIRGLHFQKDEYAQTKLVYASWGKVLDVVVDLRKQSPSFGKHISFILSDENKKMLLVPKGIAHGYAALSEKAVFNYKCDSPWNKDSERGIRFDDPDLNINWPIDADQILISEKDKSLPFLRDIESCF
jgi:dTDP-4-dehydrorhamnose 3,5-epimerase